MAENLQDQGGTGGRRPPFPDPKVRPGMDAVAGLPMPPVRAVRAIVPACIERRKNQ